MAEDWKMGLINEQAKMLLKQKPVQAVKIHTTKTIKIKDKKSKIKFADKVISKPVLKTEKQITVRIPAPKNYELYPAGFKKTFEEDKRNFFFK